MASAKKAQPEKHAGGRPSSWSKVASALKDGSLESWCRAGANDRQLSECLGISESTFFEYKKKFPQLSEFLTHARKPIVVEAFEGLVKLSKGFEHTVTRQSKKEVLDKNGNVIVLHEAIQETAYYPPNPTACTKVIVNYLNQAKKGGGVPESYLSEPIPEQQQAKTGRLDEMDGALRELFFGGKSDES